MTSLFTSLLIVFLTTVASESSAAELSQQTNDAVAHRSTSPFTAMMMDDTVLQEALMISQQIRNGQLYPANADKHEHNNRHLQVNPDEQCEFFNQVYEGTRTCECERYDRRDTKINCTYIEEQCQGEACFDGSLIIIQDRYGGPRQVTTCTNLTKGDTRLLNTCVTVDSVEGTNMTEIASCEAQLNGETCNYCHHCGDRTLTIDCCNVMEDTKQEECRPVTANGAFSPFFPAVSEPGTCKGSYGYKSSAPSARLSFGTTTTSGVVVVSTLASLAWVWGL